MVQDSLAQLIVIQFVKKFLAFMSPHCSGCLLTPFKLRLWAL